MLEDISVHMGQTPCSPPLHSPYVFLNLDDGGKAYACNGYTWFHGVLPKAGYSCFELLKAV